MVILSEIESNHDSFERYQDIVFVIPSSKLVLGDHPNSFLIFDESLNNLDLINSEYLNLILMISK